MENPDPIENLRKSEMILVGQHPMENPAKSKKIPENSGFGVLGGSGGGISPVNFMKRVA